MMKANRLFRYKFTTMLLWWACCLCGIISYNSTAWANYGFNKDDITIKTMIDKRSFYVGQAGQLQIYVNGSRSPSQPMLPDIAGVEFSYIGGQDRSSSSVTIINGRRTERRFDGYIFIYEMVASRAGEIVIPSVSVFVEGTEYKSNTLTVRIMEPVDRDDIRVGITVDNVTPFVGEPILFTVTLYLNTPIQSVDFRFPGLLNRFEVYDLPGSGNGNSSRLRGHPQKQQLELLGSSTPVEFGQVRIDGKAVTTCTLQKYLVARKPGVQSVGPGVMTCDIVIRRARGFFDSDKVENVVVPSNGLELDVKPLPDQDKPPHFSGLIGRYKIAAQANPTSVGIGDPIDLEIRVSRVDGPVLREPKLDLSAQPGFAEDFRASEETPDPENIGGVIVYKQTIRAIHSEMSEIPAIELVYFNIDKGKYETAASQPIPLEVHETKVVTASDAVGGISSGAAGVGIGVEIDDAAQGIAYNYETTDVLVNQRFNLVEKLCEPAWAAAIVIPPASYAVISLVIIFIKRSRRYELVRIRRAALATALGNLRLAGKVENNNNNDNTERLVNLAGIIYRYFADKFTLPEAGITTEDCITKVESLNTSSGSSDLLAESLADILRRCDGARYGGVAQSEVVNMYKNTIRVLKDIDLIIGNKNHNLYNGGEK